MERSPYDLPAVGVQQRPGGIAHESGELHRLLVESVEDYAIFALDPQGYVLSWNAGAKRFKGYEADEIIGKHFSIFYPKERIEEGFPDYELREAARVGRFEDEGWRIRKDGSRFWANVVITALHDSSGELVGYAKVTRDLSERRAAEEALRESEERFRLLVQSVKEYAIFMLDPTGHVATWNEGAERINGYAEAEIVGQHFSKFYPPEDVARHKPQRELEIATRTGKYEEEGWRIRKDRSRFWSSVLITALRNSDGQLIGFAKVTRDLTERRAAEARALDQARRVAVEEGARRQAEASRERSERLQALTAGLSAAYTIPEITEVLFGVGFEKLGVDASSLGLVDDASHCIRLVSDRGFPVLPPWVRTLDVDDDVAMAEAVRTRLPVVFRSRAERDARFPKLRDVLSPYEVTVVLPLAARDRMSGAVALHRKEATLTDSDLELMLSFAQQLAQALERARLYEAEQQARSRADVANRAKSEFLAAMSHELRTPLNAIAGYADLIDMGLRGPVTPEQREDIARIKRSQQHLLGIINDILNFSRAEAGQITYDIGAVPISEVLDQVAHMIEPQANGKGLRLELGRCPTNAVAWADKAKVQQIMLNLVSNAVKFTPSGVVSMSCEIGGADQNQLLLTVRDSGIGIPTEQLNRIFEPFVQVGRSLTYSHEGTGLGLAISRDLARAMGGEITVTSKVGVGSVFTLSLPSAGER